MEECRCFDLWCASVKVTREFHVCLQVKIHKMEDSNNSKPFMVTSSLNFKVTTPSFYNQPKKFASVAPPRPKSLTPPSAPSPTPVSMGVIGRVGDLPPPPPSLCDGTFLIYPALPLVELGEILISCFCQVSESHFKVQGLNV